MVENDTHTDTSIVESLQSLIVAFVLAMTFRGFVTEGFVIPTGSMAPTLMGQHVLVHSDQTGSTFPIGIKTDVPGIRTGDRGLPDALLGPDFLVSRNQDLGRRMGDRILVIKSLYPFMSPKRFDVVVFKNPTDPDGKSANYIKRLIGLPSEKIWLADGDVFAAPNDDSTGPDDYRVQRKPEHVQRASWQVVHDSDFVPVATNRFDRPPSQPRNRAWRGWTGGPWRGEGWDTSTRAYVRESAEPSKLIWDVSVRGLNDWTSYDTIEQGTNGYPYPVSDIRVRAGVEAETPESLDMTFELETRGTIFQYIVRGGDDPIAEVRMRDRDDPDGWTGSGPQEVSLPAPGRVFDVEFWHVDQAMSLYINGRRVARHEYEWSGRERMFHSMGVDDFDRVRDYLNSRPPPIERPQIQWRFAGSPLTLHRVRTDRDLYYRPGRIMRSFHNPDQPGFKTLVANNSHAFGTHPDKPATLGPDHFFMLGDNSQASLDSRLWGNPHPLVAEQVDPSPFVVHRDLMIGKAWVVYFPAPFRIKPDGLPVVPDMGRLRFIR